MGALFWGLSFFFMSVLVILFHHFSRESSWIFFYLESQFFFKSHNQLFRVELILLFIVLGVCVCVGGGVGIV